MSKAYYASMKYNPDAFGMDFTTYTWKGVVVENGNAKVIILTGRNAMAAYLQSKSNTLYECLSTGAIAAPVGYAAPKRKKKSGAKQKSVL